MSDGGCPYPPSSAPAVQQLRAQVRQAQGQAAQASATSKAPHAAPSLALTLAERPLLETSARGGDTLISPSSRESWLSGMGTPKQSWPATLGTNLKASQLRNESVVRFCIPTAKEK